MNTKILDVRQGKVINPVSELHAKDVRIAELQDALEFSERVAEKLADSISNELNFVSGKSVVQEAVEYRGKRHTIAWARLKLARLIVEEEMNGR